MLQKHILGLKYLLPDSYKIAMDSNKILEKEQRGNQYPTNFCF